jgi:predicted adenine nucleotide alpha hydrolase (AANH) superfamily ATPase
MYTSILVIALASTMNSVQVTDGIAWQSEYKAAQAEVIKTGKPLAVFIGNGDHGWNKVVREGNLTPEARQNLNKHFTCVYVNTATAEGKALAKGFEIETRGLVISDVKGTKQAFSHAGDLTQDEVKTVLVKYADVKAVATTESLGRNGDGYVAPPAPVIRSFSGPGAPIYDINGRCVGNR